MGTKAIIDVPLPLNESQKAFAPAALAYEIVNLQLTTEGTLRSVRGPAPLIPDYGAGYPYTGRMHGVFHARLEHGQRDVVLVRSGDTLYEQTGWTKGVRTLQTGLSSDPTSPRPDTFVEVAGKVVWANGIDTPLIYDGYRLLPLGYPLVPGAPTPVGPSDSGHPVFRNQDGYSHPGKIGSVGDTFTAQDGSLLAGAWYYYVQYQDVHGNRSALSRPSAPVVLRQEFSQSRSWDNYNNYVRNDDAGAIITFAGQPLGLLSVQLDDLTKQFLVSGIPLGPAGTAKRILFRSQDAVRSPSTALFLVELDDNCSQVYPDNTPDSGLGAPAIDYIPVPTFGIACAHEGCLVVVDDRVIRMSDPLFPGSFRRTMYTPLGSSGSEPTGVFSFNKKLYAATETSLYIVERTETGLHAKELPQGRGLVATASAKATGLGVLVGLDWSGFWTLDGDENVRDISDAHRSLFKRLNPGMLSRACAEWDPYTQQYLCALPEAGAFGNKLIECWDGVGWRKYRLGLAVSTMCVLRDFRRSLLIGGRNGVENNVWMLDHEVGTYTTPTRTYAFRSAWLRMDPTGLRRSDVQHIYVALVESHRTDITWTTWSGGSRDTAVSTGTLQAVNPKTTDVLNTLVVGTGKTRTPKLVWKEFGVRLRGEESFAFDLTSTSPNLHIAAFAISGEVADPQAAKVSRQ